MGEQTHMAPGVCFSAIHLADREHLMIFYHFGSGSTKLEILNSELM